MKDFNNIYFGKKVLITGNTGFKGSWLSQWLTNLGANIVGYSLPPEGNPNLFDLLSFDYETHYKNIADYDSLHKVIKIHKPEIVFHLAAQPLVSRSYKNPSETYYSNVIGTLNLLEAVRSTDSVKAIVVVTTDKCYENIEYKQSFIETDKLGGFDPYSSSKACAEILVQSYRSSFFNINEFNKTHFTLIATARAGNVIGGGDWSVDRLIPDIVKAAAINNVVSIRRPNSIRPWQHVLEPLCGYLQIGMELLEGKSEFSGSWNFGPEEDQCYSVKEILESSTKYWDKIKFKYKLDEQCFHEADRLVLNINKSKINLSWTPRWSFEIALERTITWYKDYYESNHINTEFDLKLYTDLLS